MNDLRLKLYDQLPPEEAVLKAWIMPPGRKEMQEKVRKINPVLARALDRMGR